jgi:FMN phosphatase YigB (HAD superfamily)
MKYVALDIGNVLLHADFSFFLKKLSKSLDITMEEASYFLNRSQKLHDLGLTKMSDELRDHFKIKSPVIIDEIIFMWNDVIRPADDVLKIIDKAAREHNVQVALLSNVGLEHAEQMAQLLHNYPFFKDAIKFFSCHVGARKPSLLYYHTFLQCYPSWRGCPYVDDLQENLESSKKFDFVTHRFALDEITGSKYDQVKYKEALGELEKAILG